MIDLVDPRPSPALVPNWSNLSLRVNFSSLGDLNKLFVHTDYSFVLYNFLKWILKINWLDYIQLKHSHVCQPVRLTLQILFES